jgi:hypothetical protein
MQKHSHSERSERESSEAIQFPPRWNVQLVSLQNSITFFDQTTDLFPNMVQMEVNKATNRKRKIAGAFIRI